MKLKAILYVAATVGVAAYVYQSYVGPDQIAAAQSRVAAELKDPSSAQFRNVEQVGDRVCGEVNARNSFGGYAGFQQFYVKGDEVLLAATGTDPDAMLQRARVSSRCIEHLMPDADPEATAALTN